MEPGAEIPSQARHSALAVTSRAFLHDLLSRSDKPLDAGALAAASGLHVSTVRFHLEVLRRAGLVVGRAEDRRQRGRPRTLFSAAPRDGGRAYRLLSTVLAAGWAGSPAERSRHAERAGVATALELEPAGPGDRPGTVDGSLGRVFEQFAALGFAPGRGP